METKKRFSLPGIRAQIVYQNSIEKKEEQKSKEIAADARKTALELKRLEEEKRKAFIEEFGIKMLETAINGHTEIIVENQNKKISEFENEIRKRGFKLEAGERRKYSLNLEDKISSLDENAKKVFTKKLIFDLFQINRKAQSNSRLTSEYGYFFKNLSNNLNQHREDFSTESLLKLIDLADRLLSLNFDILKNEIESLRYISKLTKKENFFAYDEHIRWTEPEEPEKSVKDCINAKFLDWLSDAYGTDFISKVFSQIELLDLDGKKDFKIDVMKHQFNNEYTGDKSRTLIDILDIPIPFNIKTILNMFEILNYETNFQKNTNVSNGLIGHLIIKWDK